MNEKKIYKRKDDHIQINSEKDVSSSLSTGLENFYFDHQALPEFDLIQVDTTTEIFHKTQRAPIFISSMVGGTQDSLELNLRFARTAQEFGIGMGLGSQRIGLQHPGQMRFFNLRSQAPDILLFANIGAIQLNNSVTPDDCKKLVDQTGADGLILHLNPLQEALQPEGDTNFSGLLKKIETLCHHLDIPVVIKEVGWGISARTARQLEGTGIAAIDVAGAGGTSWAEVEKYRLESESARNIAASFRDWGISTAQSIVNVKENTVGMRIFASGGLSSGVDVAKCLALGADYCGFAGKFFKAAVDSEESLRETVLEIIKELQICMFAAGTMNISALKKTMLRQR
ncbi:MAG: type 2 isopentenyl-diphosphate Delta-isomerase [Anaerolineaceae bacterium]|jgi:isopentenyl-diphosphate delta-isomerase|nr:MAG: type 2 isopentenyl-diphosphate Delta-isomerase [Anaerolineaceae bacterium]